MPHNSIAQSLFTEETTPEELKKLLDSEHPMILVDVRLDWEYKTCHIESSVNISLINLTQHLTQLPNDKLIVTICHHGVRSNKAADILRSAGFQNVTSLKGGVDAWAQRVDPLMKQY